MPKFTELHFMQFYFYHFTLPWQRVVAEAQFEQQVTCGQQLSLKNNSATKSDGRHLEQFLVKPVAMVTETQFDQLVT